jgi:hypothetical protein
VAEFDVLLAAELTNVGGGPVRPVGVLTRLFAGMRPDPEMFALAQELRALGVRVALLSNSWGNTYPGSGSTRCSARSSSRARSACASRSLYEIYARVLRMQMARLEKIAAQEGPIDGRVHAACADVGPRRSRTLIAPRSSSARCTSTPRRAS